MGSAGPPFTSEGQVWRAGIVRCAPAEGSGGRKRLLKKLLAQARLDNAILKDVAEEKVAPDGHMGATACIVLPGFWDKFQGEGDWRKLAWWIHDHLPYSGLYFFPKYWAFNITWSETPGRSISSYAKPMGTLTAPGMANFGGSHEAEWRGIEAAFR